MSKLGFFILMRNPTRFTVLEGTRVDSLDETLFPCPIYYLADTRHNWSRRVV
jgi:hypothetical protein